MNPRQGAATHRAADALQRATGALSTAATSRMDQDMPWFRELSAEDRSWVGMILQAGVRGFVDWFQEGGDSDGPAVATSVFGAAPRALAGVITLQQTVDLVKLSIEVVESNVDDIVSVTFSGPEFMWKAVGGGRGDATEKWNPQTRETADHSLPYLAAVALVD